MIKWSLLTTVLFLIGCGSGLDPKTKTDGNIYRLNFIAVKGSIDAGTIELYTLDSSGNKGQTLTTGTTNAGLASSTFTPMRGPVEASLTGGTYKDEATGQSISLGAAKFRMRLAQLPSNGSTLYLSPLTEMAVRYALSLGGSVADNISAANTAVASASGLSSITVAPSSTANPTLAPTDTTSETAKYGLILAGLCQQAQTLGVSSLDLASALAQDFSDGKFDGKNDGSPVTVTGAGALANDAWTNGMTAAMNTYVASNTHNPGFTTASVTTTYPSQTDATATAHTTLTSVTESSTGPYAVGDTISIQVTFSGNVTVAGGTPTLALSLGNIARTATYSSGSGTSVLTFHYTVKAGDTASDLNYTSPGALSLAGASIKDGSNFNATTVLPALTSNDSLGGGASIIIATPPSAPTVSTLAYGNASVTVGFTAPASNGGSEITGYTVTSSPGGHTGTGSSSPITVSGLTNGTEYTFKVTTSNTHGTGAESSASDSITPSILPGAPTIGAGTFGNQSATVTFSAPVSNGGAAVTSYTMTSNDGHMATGSSSPITVSGLTNGTSYTFTVTATNKNGTGAASSASNSVIPATTPNAPTIGSVTSSNGTATVAFTAPGDNGGSAITSFTVTSSPGSYTGTGSSSPITVSGLTNGTDYTFTVTATNKAGTGAPSSASAIATPHPIAPDAPTIGSGTFGNASASIDFTAPVSNGGASITAYTVTSSPGGYTGSASDSPVTVSGLTNGTSYTFTVTATNIAGTSVPSSESNAVVPATVPGAPTIGTATANNASASVTFTPPIVNGGSEVTSYTVTSSPDGFTGTGSSSPVTLSGLTNGTAYTFSVTATNKAGTGIASSNTTPVTPLAFVKAHVTLNGATGLVLVNNTTNPILTNDPTVTSTIDSDGDYLFTTGLVDAQHYTVSVATQPSGYRCAITNATGTIPSADVNSVSITCRVLHTVRATVALNGATGLVLVNNVTNPTTTNDPTLVTPISDDGDYYFSTSIVNGQHYTVSVATQPTGYYCKVANASGTMADTNITNISVTCGLPTVYANVSLNGATGLVLVNNVTNPTVTDDPTLTPINSNGNYGFTTALPNGANYNVTIATQPENYNCTVSHATGVIAGIDVTNINVTCIKNCGCPEGYSPDASQMFCSATSAVYDPTGTLIKAVPGNTLSLYAQNGAYPFLFTQSSNYPYTDHNGTLRDSANAPITKLSIDGSFWNSNGNSTDGRMNPNSIEPANETHEENNNVNYEFSFCLTTPVNGQYVFGIAADNNMGFSVGGKKIFESNSTTMSAFMYWWMGGINLAAGTYPVNFIWNNAGGPGGLGFEFYQNTMEEVQAATSISDLTVISKSADYLNQNVFVQDSGTQSTCHTGDTYNACTNKCETKSTVSCQLSVKVHQNGVFGRHVLPA